MSEPERSSQRGSRRYSLQNSLPVALLYSGPVLLELKFPRTSSEPSGKISTSWWGTVIPLRTANILPPAGVSPLSSVYRFPGEVRGREAMKGARLASSSFQKLLRLSRISVKAASSFFPEMSSMVLLKLLKVTPPWSAMRW